MNVLMLTEYYYPFDFGGSEWSTYYLACGLKKKDVNVTILTPNYGSEKLNIKDTPLEVIRFPFYKKITKYSLTPFWHTNIIWNIWTFLCVLFFSLKKDIDVIHIQGKYFLPAAMLTKLITRKKVIITLRDYIVLCPLGMCIIKHHRACTLSEYFTKDLPQYLKIYNRKSNLIAKTIIYFAAVRGKIISSILKCFLNFCDEIIVLSDVQKYVYQNSGIKIQQIIPNSMKSPHIIKSKRMDRIIFAGRLTPGKGVSTLVETVAKLSKKYPNIKTFIYGDGFLEDELRLRITELKQTKNILIKTRISHTNLLKEISLSKLTVIPSIWPEPFGRLAIESLFMGTPVVMTRLTGASGFIKNKKWGVVTGTSTNSLRQGIEYAIRKNDYLVTNINKSKKQLENIFDHETINSYMNIYRRIT